MNRKITVYVVLLVLVIGLIVLIDASKPKPINWSPTYAAKDKIPLGTYVLDKELPKIIKGDVNKVAVTPYEYLESEYDYQKNEYRPKGTALNIGEVSELDSESVKELIYYAEHGNTVVLSMKDFPPQLLDTLQVHTATDFTVKDSIALYFSDKRAGSSRYYFNEGIGLTYFDSIDNKEAKVLGYQDVNGNQRPNFIKVPIGYGSFIFHTQPAVFSNIHMLKGNHYQYTEKLLSHIKDGNIYWFTGRSGVVSGSPLRYIMNQPGLKWAVYLGLIGLAIFIFFNAKRKQRIIPEAPPLRNTTVDFTKTIGNLYYQEGNHHTIIDKKIIYFLEKIRNEYLIDTYSLDDDFVEKMHLKTGKPVKDIQQTVTLIKKHRHSFESTEADVIEINKAIENLML